MKKGKGYLWVPERYGPDAVVLITDDDVYIRSSEESESKTEHGDPIVSIFMFKKKDALDLANFIIDNVKED